MKWLLLVIGCLIGCGQAEAVTKKKPSASSAAAARQLPATPEARRSRLPVVTVDSTGPGQAGYVHYFLLTHPDESLEYHVGIELDDQRIASSFPGLGVSVLPFAKSGTVEANGAVYGIEHLYGIRPFPDDASMRALRNDIGRRVVLWVDDEIPYCAYRTRGGPFCVSCGDFAVRLLFPGRTHLMPALPQDFLRAPVGSGSAPSTDDLLLYLVGLNELPNKEARLKRISELTLPQALREDISRLVMEMDADAVPAVAAAPNTTRQKVRPGARPAPKVVQERPQRKPL